MKFTKFISEITKSLLAWVGLFMDIISGIVYLNPELVEKLSFLNVVQKYLFVWVALGTFFIIWSAWKVTNKLLEEEKKKSLSFPHTNLEQKHLGNGDNVGRDKIQNFYPDNKKKDKRIVIDEISELLTKAVEDVKWLANSAFRLIAENDFEEKSKSASKSGKEFQDYLKYNEQYFSKSERKILNEIDFFMWNEIDNINQAKVFGNQGLWALSTNKINSEIDTMRNKILDEFQKINS